MRADLHTHSCFSFDGDPAATLPAMCEAALEKGLTHLAITDHCDINGEVEGLYTFPDRALLFEKIARVKQQYEGRLSVLFGIELGQATQYPTQARALLEQYPYDIVLGSLHNLKNEQDFYFFDFSQHTAQQLQELFGRVIEESDELLDFEGLHVLTHLTYMHRYVRLAGKDLSFTPYRDRLCALFERMIKKGVALEVNTSTIAKTGQPMPTRELILLYRQCGGRLISIGSDAHKANDIAQNFTAAKQLLLDCGFTELAVPTRNGVLTFPI